MNEIIGRSGFTGGIASLLIGIGQRLIGAILILVVGRFLIRLILRWIKKSKAPKKAEPTVYRFLLTFINCLLNLILAVSVVAVLGVPMSSVIALIASAGVAIGLALQGALGNLAGGIMILIFHPFRLDDFIQSGDFSGTVSDIGLFYTTLDTPDHRAVTIPNGTVMNGTTVNFSAHASRRVDLHFPVAYGSDPEAVRRILLDTACAHSLTLDEPSPFARLTEQKDSSLIYTLRVWVRTGDYWTVYFDLLEQIRASLTGAGIVIPFPQMDIHLHQENQSEKS